MAKESKTAENSGDQLFYLVVALLVVALVTKTIFPWVSRFWQFYLLHHRQFIFCVWAALFAILGIVIARTWNRRLSEESVKAVTEKDESSVFLGVDAETKKKVHLKAEFRVGHTQVIGTTNAGKTASIILPWAVQDLEQGRGMLIIDGKSERGFLDKFYAHVVKNNREDDFMVFSLANPAISSTYNPFCGGDADQVTDRIFSAFNITDPYYSSVQLSSLRTVVALLLKRGEVPMPGVVRELLRNKERLQGWLTELDDRNLILDIQAMLRDKEDDYNNKHSGLVTALGSFSQGTLARLYNTRHSEIDIANIIKKQKICYFQLPTNLFRFLGEATGKMVLQHLQSIVSCLQVNDKVTGPLFSVYLDDFNDYIYPGFGSLLNKSRSANIGVVFCHQSMGDLEKVGDDFKKVVSTNTNIKVVMRSNDPESAEHFAKIIGTRSAEATTERRSKGWLGWKNTGEQSVRETEEFIYHPNVFKSGLKRGEGIVVIPYPDGQVIKHIRFSPVPALPIMPMPIRDLPDPDFEKASTYHGKTKEFEKQEIPQMAA